MTEKLGVAAARIPPLGAPAWSPFTQQATMSLSASEPAAFYARLFGERQSLTGVPDLPNEDDHPLGFALAIGGLVLAVLAAAGIAGYAWYHKGGGKAMLTRRRVRHALPRARARRRAR